MSNVKVVVVKPRGNYAKDAEFEIDEQVARQLVADGTARIVEVMPSASTVKAEAKHKATKKA